MSEKGAGCARPTGAQVGHPPAEAKQEETLPEEITMITAKVGAKAPDFEATAFVSGEGFKNIKLSNYEGQWVVLCFYPGDFTFV